jgi:BolA protein
MNAAAAPNPRDKSSWATIAEMEQALRQALEPTSLRILDDSQHHAGHEGARHGGHYTVQICSPRFAGLSRVARHRLVYDALALLMPRGIHALAIEASTP